MSRPHDPSDPSDPYGAAPANHRNGNTPTGRLNGDSPGRHLNGDTPGHHLNGDSSEHHRNGDTPGGPVNGGGPAGSASAGASPEASPAPSPGPEHRRVPAAVGIVLVSHSGPLAVEVAALVAGICGLDVPLVAAGGTEDGGLGTSADLVAAAVEKADRGDGVVLIPDLGGSVLTARLFEGPRAVVADVPFVEGAIAAAVAAGSGAPLQAVLAAAEEARNFRKL
ncbi:PTS-dependent dihydroxyacetone kinase phosphotransferase subunit DhaM [Planobispora siamensis]|uniref:PTS EIIA type-4 domain-containing protein n=1 Tax=Planobispora siamensis TaxID=936338 RepID=A0A8J3WMK7_9ACTN|nr:hypothetical protein [Planobispora siamensis]GIH95058.1 hypothetical protein Psi01_56880 [Planobispora siamensis]